MLNLFAIFQLFGIFWDNYLVMYTIYKETRMLKKTVKIRVALWAWDAG